MCSIRARLPASATSSDRPAPAWLPFYATAKKPAHDRWTKNIDFCISAAYNCQHILSKAAHRRSTHARERQRDALLAERGVRYRSAQGGKSHFGLTPESLLGKCRREGWESEQAHSIALPGSARYRGRESWRLLLLNSEACLLTKVVPRSHFVLWMEWLIFLTALHPDLAMKILCYMNYLPCWTALRQFTVT